MKTDRELLEEMNRNLAVLTEKVINACREVQEVQGAIFGNSHDGLKKELSDHLARHDERGKMLKALATIGSITGISGLFTAIFK